METVNSLGKSACGSCCQKLGMGARRFKKKLAFVCDPFHRKVCHASQRCFRKMRMQCKSFKRKLKYVCQRKLTHRSLKNLGITMAVKYTNGYIFCGNLISKKPVKYLDVKEEIKAEELREQADKLKTDEEKNLLYFRAYQGKI